MTPQRDPFGPPPTEPPTLSDVPNDLSRSGHGQLPRIPTPHIPSIFEKQRVFVVWLGASATIALAGLTGLLLQSRWSYASLGTTFVALITVVIAVSTPETGGGSSVSVGSGLFDDLGQVEED